MDSSLPHDADQGKGPRRRRPRYRGTHPRQFEHRYKEHNADAYPGITEQVRSRGDTPAGTHVPVLVEEILAAVRPAPGASIADCTLGYGGHAERFLERIGPTGRLIGFDVDAEQLERTRQRLAPFAANMSLHRRNFAGLAKIMAAEKIDGYDGIFADLGVSSMQIDDPRRGFSYKHDGPLDMRMDDRLPRSAAGVLAAISAADLSAAIAELGDEPDHERIAGAVIEARRKKPIVHTADLVRLVFEAKGVSLRQWRQRPKDRQRELHPAAKVFQALRILVNDELGCLRQLLRIAPSCLRPAGWIGIISFHSGEDRCVADAFRDGLQTGLYAAASNEPITSSPEERRSNPRSRSAKFRWARKR